MVFDSCIHGHYPSLTLLPGLPRPQDAQKSRNKKANILHPHPHVDQTLPAHDGREALCDFSAMVRHPSLLVFPLSVTAVIHADATFAAVFGAPPPLPTLAQVA